MMKKLVTCLLVVLFLLTPLTSCGKTSEKDAESFSAWLDVEGFVAGVSQKDFISLVNQYRYQDKSLSKLLSGWSYTNETGSGYMATAEEFGMHNETMQEEGASYAEYFTIFYTHVPLKGLSSPMGIQIGDTWQAVLEKLGLSVDPLTAFVPDDASLTDMTLSQNAKETLVFRNRTLGQEEDYRYPHHLIYTELSQVERSDGSMATVTRVVTLSFAAEGGVLDRIDMEVRERYPVGNA